jgi:hypothetical protein
MRIGRRLGVCLLALGGALAVASSAWAQSDKLEGPLIRPAVSSSDPHDLSGVWFIRSYNRQINATTGRVPDLTALGKKERDYRVEQEKQGTPVGDASAYCWPHGVPRVMNSPYPIQLIQKPDEIVIVHEVAHNVRHIYMNTPHSSPVKTAFMGESVGHWEGDTLVIDTVGVDPRTWIDEVGLIHGPKLHTVERIRKVEGGRTLENEVMIDDPDYYPHPWFMRDTYAWRPDLRIAEYSCEENNRNRPVNGHTVAK